MNDIRKTIWTGVSDGRHYLIPDDVTLSSGHYKIKTATGRHQSVDGQTVETYFVAADEAREWARSALSDVLGDLRESLESTLGKRRDDFPSRLARDYQERTGDSGTRQLTDLLKSLGDDGHAFPERLKRRMREIANKLQQDEAEREPPDS